MVKSVMVQPLEEMLCNHWKWCLGRGFQYHKEIFVSPTCLAKKVRKPTKIFVTQCGFLPPQKTDFSFFFFPSWHSVQSNWLVCEESFHQITEKCWLMDVGHFEASHLAYTSHGLITPCPAFCLLLEGRHPRACGGRAQFAAQVDGLARPKRGEHQEVRSTWSSDFMISLYDFPLKWNKCLKETLFFSLNSYRSR